MEKIDPAAERRRIEEEAALWAARSAAGSDPDQRALALAWAGECPMRAVALARAEAAWERADRLKASPPMLAPEEIAGPAGRFEVLFSRRRVTLALMAASLVASVATLAVQKITAVDHYRTGVGQQRMLRLADGSVLRLNTGTIVEVSLTGDRRIVHLVEGEALFNVAHDARRPFLVRAGSATLRALGTAFNVRLRQDLVEVTVTRGAIAVEEPNTRPQRIMAGDAAAIRPGAVAPTTLDRREIRQRIAWEAGMIELDGDTLPQAIDEFNRYRTRPIVIGDPRLASLIVGGRFATHESDLFVEALQQSFSIRAVAGTDRSVMLVKADAAAAPDPQ